MYYIYPHHTNLYISLLLITQKKNLNLMNFLYLNLMGIYKYDLLLIVDITPLCIVLVKQSYILNHLHQLILLNLNFIFIKFMLHVVAVEIKNLFTFQMIILSDINLISFNF